MMEDYLVLVNAEHPLRVQMDKTDLVCAFDDHPGVLLERTAAKALRALPACSEHETGLAIDLAANAQDIDFICPEFPRSGICQKFREAAPYYGFVERYAKEKEPVTGISGEPWHFRYVGTPHSEIMARKGMCLEEYVECRRHCEERKTR